MSNRVCFLYRKTLWSCVYKMRNSFIRLPKIKQGCWIWIFIKTYSDPTIRIMLSGRITMQDCRLKFSLLVIKSQPQFTIISTYFFNFSLFKYELCLTNTYFIWIWGWIEQLKLAWSWLCSKEIERFSFLAAEYLSLFHINMYVLKSDHPNIFTSAFFVKHPLQRVKIRKTIKRNSIK